MINNVTTFTVNIHPERETHAIRHTAKQQVNITTDVTMFIHVVSYNSERDIHETLHN